jgi:hypothetical protein
MLEAVTADDDDADKDDDRVFTFKVRHHGHGIRFQGCIRKQPRIVEIGRNYFQEHFFYLENDHTVPLTFQRDFGSVASVDSKILVTITDQHVVQIWETATGLRLCRIRGDRDGALNPVLSPDCRTIATRNANGTITVWDVTGLRLAQNNRRLPLSAAEFERCWASLANRKDGEDFFRAFWKLVADPEQTVARLGERLKAVPAANRRRIEQSITELDSSEFTRRAGATRELEHDESALPLLRDALNKQPSAETERRITLIVKKLEAGPGRGPEALRVYRIVQLLERIATPAAVDLLRRLSRGAEAAMLTTEARASLARLGK